MKNLKENVLTLEVRPYSLIKILFFIGIALLFIRISEVVLLLFMAFIIMSATKPAAVYLNTKLKIPEGLAISIVVVSILTILSISFYLISVPLTNEVSKFAENIPALSNNIADWVAQIPILSNNINQQEITTFFSNLFSTIIDKLNTIANTLGGAILSAFRGIVLALFIIIFSIYLFLDRELIISFIIKLFRLERDNFFKVYNKVESQLGAWVRGQIFLCFAVGLTTYIGLTLLDIKYALPLGILAGILEIVPIIGPVITGIILTLVGLSISPVSGVLCLILSIAIQQLENNFLVPVVMKRAVGISPVLTIISLLIGQELFGLLGAVISVPAAAMFSVIISNYLDTRVPYQKD